MDAIDFAVTRYSAMEEFDLFPNPALWPNVQRDYLMKQHLKQMERVNFMAFLVGNGMDPQIARLWVLYPGHGYDRNAVEHVKTLADALPARRINTTYYDMLLCKYVNLMTGEELSGSTGAAGKGYRKY